MPLRSAALRQHRENIVKFGNSLASLCSIMEQEESLFGDGRWYPKKGQESRANELACEVDQLAGPAAYAFDAAGSFVEWKPRGTWNTKPVNPAMGWRTIIDVDPMFPPSVIFACCNQATGILTMKAEQAEEREASKLAKVESAVGYVGHLRRSAGGEPGRYGPIILASFLTLVGTLAATWFSVKFGWINPE